MRIEGRLPSVVEYYKEFIDSSVDLAADTKQCCPFHSEKTPSFSYNPNTGTWRCFGACHTGGGVVRMHKMYFHFSTDEEAETDLRKKYNVAMPNTLDAMVKDSYVSEDSVEDQMTYAEAVALANTPERWLELDYAMSKYPYDRLNLIDLIIRWKGNSVI